MFDYLKLDEENKKFEANTAVNHGYAALLSQIGSQRLFTDKVLYA